MFDRIYVEISNICNLQCDFCPPVERQKHVMSADLFAQIAPQLRAHASEICLHLMGEPLGHPEFRKILRIASDHNLQIQLTTNGVLLNPTLTETCLNSTVRQVNISVHSFEANFGRKDVGPYMRKVFAFARAALEQRPDLYINYRLWDMDGVQRSEKNLAIREAIEHEYDFTFQDLRVDIRRKKGYRLLGRLYLHFDSRFTWPSLAQEMRSERGTCHALRGHIGIHADGTVVPCCLDKEAIIPLGNCFKNNLADILREPRAVAMRKGFDEGRLCESLCQRCDFITRFDP